MDKVYVEVRTVFTSDGDIIPQHIKWSDGQVYEIDRIIDICKAPSEAGGAGTRYTIRVLGKERCLFFENIYSETGKFRWFVETNKQVV
jgi:hypothetical protein